MSRYMGERPAEIRLTGGDGHADSSALQASFVTAVDHNIAPGATVGCLRLLAELRTPFLSVSDVLTDVWTAQHFLEQAQIHGERPVFFYIACAILVTSACAGSAFTLLVHRGALLAAIRTFGANICDPCRDSPCVPLFTPCVVLLLFILLCPIGHLLPVALWALATWRPPPAPPLLVDIQRDCARYDDAANKKALEVMERTGDVSEATSAALTAWGRAAGRALGGSADSVGHLGAYDCYALAYRAYLRETLAASLQPAPPEEPQLEPFARSSLDSPARPAAFDAAEERYKLARDRLRLAESIAEREWLGEGTGEESGFVALRLKEAKDRRSLSHQQLLRAFIVAGAHNKVLPAAQFTSGGGAVPGLEGFIDQLRTMVLASLEMGYQSARTLARMEMLKLGQIATRYFPKGTCKSLVDSCGPYLDDFCSHVEAEWKAKCEHAELVLMVEKINQAEARFVNAKQRVDARRGDIGFDDDQLQVAVRVASAAAETKRELREEAQKRSRRDKAVAEASTACHEAEQVKLEFEKRHAARELVFQMQLQKQRRMVYDHDIAVASASKILAAEFQRAKFDHKVASEAGFIVETSLESLPQSLLQCSAITILTRDERRAVTLASYVSVALSVYTVLTKVYVFCHSLDPKVFNLKIAAICYDTLTLFYTVTTLWGCRKEDEFGCQHLLFLTRAVDVPAASYLCLFALWGALSAIAFAGTMMASWIYCVLTLRKVDASVENPLWRAATWLMGYDLGCFELCIIALITAPFVVTIAMFGALFASVLIPLVVATMRLSYLVLWLHLTEVRLFTGPSRALYVCVYDFVRSGDEGVAVRHRLTAAVDILTELREEEADAVGYAMPPPVHDGPGLREGFCSKLLLALDCLVAIVNELRSTLVAAAVYVGLERVSRPCLSVFIWGLLLPSVAVSSLYAPFVAGRSCYSWVYGGRDVMTPFQGLLLCAALFCGSSVLGLLCLTSASIFLRFALASPTPDATQVLEIRGGEAAVLQRLRAAVGTPLGTNRRRFGSGA